MSPASTKRVDANKMYWKIMRISADYASKDPERPTQRAPDWWESARFQAVCVAWSEFRQNSVVSSRPPAGNASR